ncbi:MAG TPA: class IV adenylate cyclase [Candidatus Angelobacter sp.]
MSSAVETEIKFRMDDVPALTVRLPSLGFRIITPRTHEMNTLFDLRGRPLRRKGALLRVRKYGDSWTVTFKAKATPGRYKSRREIETGVEDGEALLAILENVGFRPVFSYEKFRSEWSDGQGHLLIDETPIGNFGEIEGPGNWIDSTAARLNIQPGDYITDSYAILFLKWKRRTHSKARNMCFAEVRRS